MGQLPTKARSLDTQSVENPQEDSTRCSPGMAPLQLRRTPRVTRIYSYSNTMHHTHGTSSRHVARQGSHYIIYKGRSVPLTRPTATQVAHTAAQGAPRQHARGAGTCTCRPAPPTGLKCSGAPPTGHSIRKRLRPTRPPAACRLVTPARRRIVLATLSRPLGCT